MESVSAVELITLPDEIVETIAASICATLNGPTDLARLASTCTHLRQHCSDHALLGRLGAERGEPCVASLEQLAVLEALRNVGLPIRIVFMGADTEIRPGSLARLDDLALLMLQHRRLTLSIEAHTGRNAPPAFAPAFTRARAERVSKRLRRSHVPQARISACRGWGSDIAIAAGWQPGIESARAELFFTLDNLTLPPRPSYYDGRTAPTSPDEGDELIYGSDDDSMSASSISESSDSV